MTDVCLVLTTLPDAAKAETLARAVVEARLAACASVVPGVVSLYWWEGKVQREGEALVLCKVPRDGVDALIAGVKARHPYEVPEILAVPVTAGWPAYLAWVAAEARPR